MAIKMKYLHSCLLIIVIAIVGFICILSYMGLFPFEGHVPSKQILYSKTIEVSQRCGAFIHEYKQQPCMYRGVKIRIKTAFAEYGHYLLKEDSDSICLNKNSYYIHVIYENLEQLQEVGYGKTWIIDDKMVMPSDDGQTTYWYKSSILPDTLVLYIRECHPSLDSIDANYYSNDLEHQLNWDTIQSIILLRK